MERIAFMIASEKWLKGSGPTQTTYQPLTAIVWKLRIVGQDTDRTSSTSNSFAWCFPRSASASDWCVLRVARRSHTGYQCADQEQPHGYSQDNVDTHKQTSLPCLELEE
jgi:hypothetical protein